MTSFGCAVGRAAATYITGWVEDNMAGGGATRYGGATHWQLAIADVALLR